MMRLFIIFFTISSITGFTQYAVNKTDPKLKVVYQPEPKLVNQETLINNYLKEIFGNVNSPKENQQDMDRNQSGTNRKSIGCQNY
jgi:hypothetical protein